MTASQTDRLVIIGGGPKAMSVAAKAHVLASLGLPAPHVTVIEPTAIGGNWLPSGGWTDGRHRLGTSPEKDVGFPYHSTVHRPRNADVNAAMQQFSWTSFLVERGTYAEWVDRGRPSPEHNLWAKYLQWVGRKVAVDTIAARAESIGIDGRRWQVRVAAADGTTNVVEADRLMMTGPGSSDQVMARHPKVLSIAEFWRRAGSSELPASTRAAVIGGGETAGSALDELIRHDILTVSVISPGATIYTRGESYFENSLYSTPVKWRTLSVPERRDVVRRTDRGVFSVRVQESLLSDERVAHLQGRVVQVTPDGDGVSLTLRNEFRPDQQHSFDLVIDAVGGKPLWFFNLFDDHATDQVELCLGGPITQERVEAAIGHDLSLEGLPARLHLPNLSALAQGPGFPNLSCLGELSDRVLASTRAGAPDPFAAHAITTATTTRT